MLPFGVAATGDELLRLAFQVFEDGDFCFQFGDVLRCARLVDELVGKCFVFFGGVVVVKVVPVFRQADATSDGVFAQWFGKAWAACRFFACFFQALFQPFVATFERLMDGCRAGGKAALQDGEREADVVFFLSVEFICAVHFVAHVVTDVFVERGFFRREFVTGGVGAAFGEKRRAVKFEQVFFDHAAHEVGDVVFFHAVAYFAVEAVAIEQR